MAPGLETRVTIDASNVHPDFNGLALPAALFTATGKRAATVEALDAHSARVTVGEGCPDGSIAILVRHGVRVFGTLHRTVDQGTRLEFDDPLDGWRQARFVENCRPLRPVIVADGLAA
jgi:hypothetical protein